jgi:transcriptional regulator of acetoin/glycerol metabolism
MEQDLKTKFIEILSQNNVTETAKRLGVTRQTVYNYMKFLGIKPDNTVKENIKKAISRELK